MMLQELYAFAQRSGLLENPDFENKRVDYILRVNQTGEFIALIPTKDAQGKSATRIVPKLPKRSVGIAPGFFFDNSQYVLGVEKAGAKRAGRGADCLAEFTLRVGECASATQDVGAGAVHAFLKNEEERKRALGAVHEPLLGDENIAFTLDSCDVDELVHERVAVSEHWKRQRAAMGNEESERQRCLVTGDLTVPARLHPSIKRVPAAQSSGATLVSFNSRAFESHGMSQGDNAPVSGKAAEGYVTALNWMLEKTELRRFRQGLSLSEDSVFIYWTREAHPIVDIFADVLDPSPEVVADVAKAPWKGLAPSPIDSTAFFGVTLAGNAARVVVRDWFQTTVAEVKRTVDLYFEDLALGKDEPIPLSLLLRSLESPGGGGVGPFLATKLVGAALHGSPIPFEVAVLALKRLRIPPDPKRGDVLRAQCALIKATLIRWRRRLNHKVEEITVSLDESNHAVPYLLGRLFAILERLQAAALGDLNATIRDRYFGAASSTPGLVFPRLLRLSIHHAAKVDSPWLEKIKGSVVASLPASPMPSLLSLEEQGLFAIGYYHQREKFFERKQQEKGDQ